MAYDRPVVRTGYRANVSRTASRGRNPQRHAPRCGPSYVKYFGPWANLGEFEAKISNPALGQSPRSQHETKTAARGGTGVAPNRAVPVKCLSLPTGALFGHTAGAANPPRPRGLWPEPPRLETGHLGARIPSPCRYKAKALAIPETPKPIQRFAYAAADSPIDGAFGAVGGGIDEANQAIPNAPSEVCLHVRKLLSLPKDHEILKGASLDVPPDTNTLCQRMVNEVNSDVMPGDSHATAIEAINDEFGLKTSATTPPGLLNVMFVTMMASRKIRVQCRLLGIVTTAPT